MKSQSLPVTFAFVLACALAGCKKQPAAPEESAPENSPLPPGKTGTAAIVGTIRFRGTLPPPALPKSSSFPECNRPGKADPTLETEKDGLLKNAFVWIKEGLPPGAYPVPSEAVIMDQKHCEFMPRVVGVRVGQSITFVNSDAFLHNVKTTVFNIPMPTAGVRSTQRVVKPQVMMPVSCDVHAWMRAYLGVVPHPYFAVTSADGSFAIRTLPAGNYTLEVWHERLIKQTEQIALGDAETKTTSIEMKAP